MSGLIPQPFLDDLLRTIDLVELIDSYVPLKKKGGSYLACCPFHNEKNPSFNVIAKKQFYHCFGCGASGNAISFAMQYLNQGFVEAVETLAARAGLTIPREGPQNKKNSVAVDLYKLLLAVSVHYQQVLKTQGQTAAQYLTQRGITADVIEQYQLGFAPEGWHNLEKSFPAQQQALLMAGMLIKSEEGKVYDRYRNRVMFPIHDRNGRMIGFGGRVLDADSKPKYLNSPETVIFQKNRELYGLHQLLSQQKTVQSVLVVEGYMDVIALAQFGIGHAVATLGTATSIYHVQLLAKHCQQIIFCFDGDAAGRQAAWRALDSSLAYVHAGLDVGFIFLPQGHDPDSLVRLEGTDKFLARQQAAVPLHQFFFEILSKDIPLTNPAGKTQLINLAKPYLQKMAEGSYKLLMITELSRLTHIQQDKLGALIAQDKPIAIKKYHTITRTPLRIAIALLLQHPETYSKCNAVDNVLLDTTEHYLLIHLLHLVAKAPKATTAMLLEQWRNDKDFDYMHQLAAWDHQVPEQALHNEFADTLLFLQRQYKEQHIQQLINKSRRSGLTAMEKVHLQEMLQERHKG